MNWCLGVFLTVLLAHMLIIPSFTNVKADSLNPSVYSIDESPFGAPYSIWIQRWLNWSAGIPSTEHPRDFADRTCNVSQTWEDVWFLPDTLNGNIVRECEVPAGKAIFVPITTGWQSVAESEEFRGKPLDEIKKPFIDAAMYCDNHNTVRVAEVDGQKIKGLEGNSPYRTNTTQLFNLTHGENNIYEVKPQTSPAYAEGWFLFLKPLPQGDHTIKIDSKIKHPTDVACDYEGHTVWKIKVM